MSVEPPIPPLLAIAVDGVVFALEPGRRYALGSHARCDLRLAAAGVPPIALHVALGTTPGTAEVTPLGGAANVLAVGDRLRLLAIELAVVVDGGDAIILPDPAMRAARGAPVGNAAAAAALDPAPTIPAATAGAGGSPGGAAGSFVDLMAHELRRLPWFAASLLLHALLLLLLFWLFPPATTGDEARTVYSFVGGDDAGLEHAPAPPAPDVVVEDPEPATPALADLPDRAPEPIEAGTPPPTTGPARASLLQIGGERVARRRPANGGASADVLDGAGAPDNGAFRQTVTELRRTGLEVVFVLDSTGSMGSSIAGAKEGIASMLQVLHALVPDARFGIVAFRDRGKAEDYLVRSLTLENDFYAAVNFVRSISAEGGGDVPEALLDALREAFRQPFRRGARRVVVLAGDAPAHANEQGSMLDEVRRFAHAGNSFVHTLLTNPSFVRASAGEDFRKIAERGGGVCATLLDTSGILREVLACAFGREFAQDLDAVRANLEARRQSPPTWALQVARDGGAELARALAADLVQSPLVDALVRLPRRDVSRQLAGLLAGDKLSPAGFQAAAYVLQEQLGLPTPPIDPARPRPIAGPTLERLLALIDRMPH